MGLDMYLMRANREEADGWDNLVTSERTVSMDQNPWDEACYWRKANQIRQWFVDNCDYPEDGNCEEVEVTKENLEKLVEVCRKVLENPTLASELLPRSEGFFFGSTLYDSGYLGQLEYTVTACEDVIRSTDWEKEKVIYTDWW
jgi:hypothetical protein